ncbi:hypothetical protein DF107_08120 [Burkholderia stagnalis]|uniref:hypothetical protein n=1 Tax=Burkholderia stagnalis TaxID=1503054 RepID=UPI000F568804|nr:hypothetical protein [Burkholderia stagnalis]RQQ10204.1 hypothetical protein DF164_11975 [Burkholderia stagnalis]RQQ20276.1 hypothetical protein DF161_06080 [Burkholderia stagnalis]RQQ29079.1 hypothetical protein DF148_25075 [Burkholderia stagnalis]RQQ29144.1 hypothetical protein DF149_20370 [Burkholderia stagnalis]RQQ37036.1 hypothetical protein DF163_01275 [Burkholderia stagnalis]
MTIHPLRTFLIASALAVSVTSHAQQVGVVTGGVYYTPNPHLAAGTPLQILPDDGTGVARCCATIKGPARKPPRQVFDSLRDRTMAAYALTMPPSIPADASGFGVVGPARFGRAGAHPEAVLDDDLRLAFSTCTSTEGVHYLARKPGSRKLLVHLYLYFDGEFEPNCKDSDLDGGGAADK